MGKITFDPTSGAVYIYAVEDIKGREVRTQDLDNHVYVDFDKETGELLGIEILSLEGLRQASEILEQ
jgi:uncharacterized protein YuzE